MFVDTSVWSLALRCDVATNTPEVKTLEQALVEGGQLVTTGLVLQELLQSFVGPKSMANIVKNFASIPFVSPDRSDHIEAAELRNKCRRAGVQVGTIDVTLAQLCIRHGLTMFTTDKDFENIARFIPLKLFL